MIVVGHNDKAVALVVHRVIVPCPPGRHQDRFRRSVVRVDQPVFRGNMVASGDDDVLLGHRARYADEKSRIGLHVNHGVVLHRVTQYVPPDPPRSPVVVQRGVEERRVVERPYGLPPHVLDFVLEQLSGFQVPRQLGSSRNT